ncbi:MAG: cyclic pyranopterin monophosphate synthase MoaC [Streptococcaceae bacterium]|jgi:cyclic pyranopterin phosphate synthase|nr:cyclic pyranopterin monophosphate synthase MoaC [Streptococcaceae bacterium]
MTEELTHINAQGRARQVDVSDKAVTRRVATATATVIMAPETLVRIKEGGIAKGDVLAVAQVAGIMAAKKTSELIPMCHVLLLTGVDISFEFTSEREIVIVSEVKTTGQTGVEMEALTAVQVAALTIYDMCKAIDRGMMMTDCHLLTKSGGKSGEFVYGVEDA